MITTEFIEKLKALDLPEGGETTIKNLRVRRINPGSSPVVGRWSLLKDGMNDGTNEDILCTKDIYDGATVVNFREPNTHWLAKNQRYYKIYIN